MRFIATYETGLDEKRRVTVPAEFRTALRQLNPNAPDTVYLWRSADNDCLEGAGEDFIDRLEGELDVLSEEDPQAAEAIRATVFGASRRLVMDSGGRVVLPERLADAVGLTDRAVFTGAGGYFRLASPAANDAIDGRFREIANGGARDRVFARARRRAPAPVANP